MNDLRGYSNHDVETTTSRSKLLGAAVVALGIGALGAYSFASGDAAQPAPQQMASNQVRTTPEGYGSQMPPPVTRAPAQNVAVNTTKSSEPPTTAPEASKTPLDGTPLDPGAKSKAVKEKPASEPSKEAAVQPKTPAASPKPEMTPPENAQPAQPVQPAAVPEQPAPQEPAPTENTTPPQGQ